LDQEVLVILNNFILRLKIGYVFEAYDHNNKRKVALKRIEKVGT